MKGVTAVMLSIDRTTSRTLEALSSYTEGKRMELSDVLDMLEFLKAYYCFLKKFFSPLW
jgi:hypothetical protein